MDFLFVQFHSTIKHSLFLGYRTKRVGTLIPIIER